MTETGFVLIPDGTPRAIEALRAACPSFGQPVGGESPYEFAWLLANHLVSLVGSDDSSELGAVFATVEHLLVEDEPGVRELVVVGLIEDLQNACLSADPPLQRPLHTWLGPLSTTAWDEVARFWGAVR